MLRVRAPGEQTVKPYFAGKRSTLYLGDAREVSANLLPMRAGLVVADPPYGARWRSGFRKDRFDAMVGDADSVGSIEILAEVLKRHLPNRKHIYVFGYPANVITQYLLLGGTAELIWAKGSVGLGNLQSPWAANHEVIVFGAHTTSASDRKDGRGQLTARMRHGSVITVPRLNALQHKRHPSEKPVKLLAQLIESSSHAGDVVLDPFAGVGSTSVAAVLLGRHTVGIEIVEKYAEIAATRLARAELLADQIEAS